MTSSDDLNETTKNLIEALNSVKEETTHFVIKLTYEASTGRVTGCTFDDTSEPWIEITRQQYNSNIHLVPGVVVEGKWSPITKGRRIGKRLKPGNTWHTVAGNMLIVGNDDGWDRVR